MVIAYKYRLNPTPDQVKRLFELRRLSARVWNRALTHLVRSIWSGDAHVDGGASGRLYTAVVKGRDLGGLPASMANTILRKLLVAWEMFLRDRGGDVKCPRYRANGMIVWAGDRCNLHTIVESANRCGRAITPRGLGLGELAFIAHRALPGPHGQISVSTDPLGRWWISLSCKRETAPVSNGRNVGIDVGIRNLISDSDGNRQCSRPVNARALRKRYRMQRRAAKMKVGGSRRTRLEARIARVEADVVARQREHEWHIADRYSRYAHVAVEDLTIRNLMRGTSSHGRALKRGLRQVRLGSLLAAIKQKTEERGNVCSRVNPAYTSQTCHACGAVDRASRQGEAYRCTTCGHEDHADLNAAKNIRDRALAGQVKAPKRRIRTAGSARKKSRRVTGDRLDTGSAVALPRRDGDVAVKPRASDRPAGEMSEVARAGTIPARVASGKVVVATAEPARQRKPQSMRCHARPAGERTGPGPIIAERCSQGPSQTVDITGVSARAAPGDNEDRGL